MKKSVVFVLALIVFVSLAPMAAFAAEGAEEGAAKASLSGLLALALPLGAAFAIGIAALGGTLAQGNAVRGALEGIARNPGTAPKIQTAMIIGLAFIESLVIYALVVAMMLIGKLP